MANTFDKNRLRKTYSVFRARPVYVTVGGETLSFGSPVSIGTSNSDGVATTAARSDHVHNHDSQPGGSLHASASITTAGFMSAADKVTLNSLSSSLAAYTVSSEAVSNSLFLRNAVKNGSLNVLTASTVYTTGTLGFVGTTTTFTSASTLLLTLSDVAGATQATAGARTFALAGNAVTNTATAYCNFQAGTDLYLVAGAASSIQAWGTTTSLYDSTGTLRATISNQPNWSLIFANTLSSITMSQAQDASAAGANFVLQAQQGASGFAGGDLYLGGGQAGTPGSQLSGNTIVLLGSASAGNTAKLSFRKGTPGAETEFASLRAESNSITTLNSVGELVLSAGSYAMVSSVDTIFRASSQLVFDNGTSPSIWRDNTFNARMAITASTTPHIMFLPSVTAVSMSMARASSGAGGNFIIQAQQGASGSAGGDLILAAGLGGVRGTNEAGDVRVKVGDTVAGVSSQFYIEREGGTKIVTIYEVAGTSPYFYFGGAGGTSNGVIRGAALSLESSTTHVAIIPGTDAYIGHSAGYNIFHREAATNVLTEHMDADGPVTWTYISAVPCISSSVPGSLSRTYVNSPVTSSLGAARQEFVYTTCNVTGTTPSSMKILFPSTTSFTGSIFIDSTIGFVSSSLTDKTTHHFKVVAIIRVDGKNVTIVHQKESAEFAVGSTNLNAPTYIHSNGWVQLDITGSSVGDLYRAEAYCNLSYFNFR